MVTEEYYDEDAEMLQEWSEEETVSRDEKFSDIFAADFPEIPFEYEVRPIEDF